MKTGRLLKFKRPGGDVHAYLYREGDAFRASLFVLGSRDKEKPLAMLSGESEALLEQELRAWVESHFPKGPPKQG